MLADRHSYRKHSLTILPNKFPLVDVDQKGQFLLGLRFEAWPFSTGLEDFAPVGFEAAC